MSKGITWWFVFIYQLQSLNSLCSPVLISEEMSHCFHNTSDSRREAVAPAFLADCQFCIPSAILPRDVYRRNWLKLSVLMFCLTTFQITEVLNWALVLLPSDFQDLMYAAGGGRGRSAKQMPHSLCNPDCCVEQDLHLPAREPRPAAGQAPRKAQKGRMWQVIKEEHDISNR